MRCGAYSFDKVLLLVGFCKGRPKDAAAHWRLLRVASGRHPVSGSPIGAPQLTELALEAFHLILGED